MAQEHMYSAASPVGPVQHGEGCGILGSCCGDDLILTQNLALKRCLSTLSVGAIIIMLRRDGSYRYEFLLLQ